MGDGIPAAVYHDDVTYWKARCKAAEAFGEACMTHFDHASLLIDTLADALEEAEAARARSRTRLGEFGDTLRRW
jgi:hypothetical protein